EIHPRMRALNFVLHGYDLAILPAAENGKRLIERGYKINGDWLGPPYRGCHCYGSFYGVVVQFFYARALCSGRSKYRSEIEKDIGGIGFGKSIPVKSHSCCRR